MVQPPGNAMRIAAGALWLPMTRDLVGTFPTAAVYLAVSSSTFLLDHA